MGTTASKGASFKKDLRDFPGIPVVKIPPCNVRASLVAQTVKNLPAMRETWLWSLGWEDPLEEGMATHSSILVWRIPWTSPQGRKESDTTEQLSLCNVEDTGPIPGRGAEILHATEQLSLPAATTESECHN